MTKTCSKCKTEQPIENFRKVKRWTVNRCRSCTIKENRIYRSNPVVKKREYEYKRKYVTEDPVRHKAQVLIGGLQWGRGGGDRMIVLIKAAIGTTCKYCGVELGLQNLSLDHKTPVAHALRKKSKRTPHNVKTSMSSEEYTRLNSEENLQIVCLTCNRSKGNLTDDEYTDLLEFLESYPRMKQIVIAKLKGSNFMYRA